MDSVVQLRAGGACLVAALAEPVPYVLHWGRDLGELSDEDCAALRLTAGPAVVNDAFDTPRRFSVWPTEAEGWSGTPAQQGHRGGSATTPRVRLTRAHQPEPAELVLEFDDPGTGLDTVLTYRLGPAGILEVKAALTREDTGGGTQPYDLAAVATMLPLPARATEILDFTGKWCRERSPQRRPLGFGSHVREVRRGKPGLDSPYLLTVGTPGFGFRSGEVWAVHVGWSGDQRWFAERLPDGAGVHAGVFGGGELLRPGEIRLAPGESYETPVSYFAWSGDGLDGLAERFHTFLRAGSSRTATPRPLVLNTWEAVYFDHDPARLVALAELAAEVGVERLVLDDGWFRGRRDDTAGLGDWTVDAQVWPGGLAPLADRVHELGLQFGLWFEPEMVNLDSDLARAHPEWILGPGAGLGPESRHQYVLNLAADGVREYLLGAIGELVTRYRIDYLKWDHNRELHEAVHRRPGGADTPGVHAQTLALYRLLDELRERHPLLEIESCASGGGRVDLGILARTDRVWASDCNDPLERQSIQRWTGQLLPPEFVGTHVGEERSHTTGRRSTASFRLLTSLFGHAGLEQDLTRCSAEELRQLTAWSALYREFRPVLHSGRQVRADLPDDSAYLHGVVAADGSSALYCWARLTTAVEGQPGRVLLPGLDPDAGYLLRVRGDVGLPALQESAAPEWLAVALDGGVRLRGVVLTEAGLPMPNLNPEQALLLDVRRVG